MTRPAVATRTALWSAVLTALWLTGAGPLAAQTDPPQGLPDPMAPLMDLIDPAPDTGASGDAAPPAASGDAAGDSEVTGSAGAEGVAGEGTTATGATATGATGAEGTGETGDGTGAQAPAVSSGGLVGTATPRDMVSVMQGGPDYAAWRRTAERTEAITETGRGSDFALERLRADLVDWRDRFLAAQSMNAARIDTVRAQIAALGPPPEGDMPEDERVVARRALLRTELARLRAPAILAAEAHTQASGLIREVDALIRERQASQLLGRGQSPLHPAVWTDAATTLGDRFTGLWLELRAALRSEARRARLVEALPRIVVLTLIGGVLLLRGRAWTALLGDRVSARSRRGRGVWTFLLSLGQIALPLAGLVAIGAALDATGLAGFRARQLIDVLPEAGLAAIVARWLAGHFFAPGAEPVMPLDFAANRRVLARHLVVGLGWTLAVLTVMRAFLATGEVSDAVAAAIGLPFALVAAALLFRLGRLMTSRLPGDRDGTADPTGYSRTLLTVTGKVVMLVAVAAPLLLVLGYVTAAQALIYPTVMTLAVIGVVILLQRLTFDTYALVTEAEDGNRDGLLPVLIGLALVVLSLPVLSLIWGGRVEDLVEVWARFREGYAIGETRISPGDFATFLLVFAIGFMLTRLVQGVLRTTVLPKTRMDIGGRNAVVAGLGYVGILTAAILAVTSAGIDLSNLAIVAGALSVGIGFGLQNIVSNFVSGIILLIERPISEGDWIEVNGQMGYVRDISVRSTRIETFDRTDVIVPNADLVSQQVTNWTRGNLVGRIIVPVGVAYGTDTDRVATILREVAEAHPMVILVPPPAILLAGFGADSINFEIRAILRDVNFSLSAKSEINHEIARRFAAEDISIPFPQRDIWLRNPEALRPAAAGDADAGAADGPAAAAATDVGSGPAARVQARAAVPRNRWRDDHDDDDAPDAAVGDADADAGGGVR